VTAAAFSYCGANDEVAAVADAPGCLSIHMQSQRLQGKDYGDEGDHGRRLPRASAALTRRSPRNGRTTRVPSARWIRTFLGPPPGPHRISSVTGWPRSR
jgi:hypothetical protein